MEEKNVYLWTTSQDCFHSNISQIYTALHVDLLLWRQFKKKNNKKNTIREPLVLEVELSSAQISSEIPTQKKLWPPVPQCIDPLHGPVETRKCSGKLWQLFYQVSKLKTESWFFSTYISQYLSNVYIIQENWKNSSMRFYRVRDPLVFLWHTFSCQFAAQENRFQTDFWVFPE